MADDMLARILAGKQGRNANIFTSPLGDPGFSKSVSRVNVMAAA